MTQEDLVYIRTAILKISQEKLAYKMGYKTGSGITVLERQGSIIPGYFENHLRLLVEKEGKLFLTKKK